MAISLYEFMQRFPGEDAATAFFEERRWGSEPYCPHCGGINAAAIASRKPMPYRCRDCRRHFSVRTGTVLASSHVPLHKWLMAICMLHTARKGVASTQLARELGVTQKTAWFLNHRIRKAMEHRGSLLAGEVEVDETYIGGRERNKHEAKRLRAGRGPVGKQAVLGLRERAGAVRALPVASVDRSTLHASIVENVRRGSMLYTDALRAYSGLPGYGHDFVEHGIGEYVRGRVHTNSIESFWALLKRGYIGVYHYMSPKHLHRYINEFAYRQSIGNDNGLAVIGTTIDGMIGRRLRYKELTA